MTPYCLITLMCTFICLQKKSSINLIQLVQPTRMYCNVSFPPKPGQPQTYVPSHGRKSSRTAAVFFPARDPQTPLKWMRPAKTKAALHAHQTTLSAIFDRPRQCKQMHVIRCVTGPARIVQVSEKYDGRYGRWQNSVNHGPMTIRQRVRRGGEGWQSG